MDHNKLENSEREENTRPPYLPPEKSVGSQEATIRTRHGTTDWFQFKEYIEAVYCHSVYVLYRVHHVKCWAGEAQAGIKIVGSNISNLRYADDTTLMVESKKELKSLLMKVKRRVKTWLETQHSKNNDHGIQSHPFMANRMGKSGNGERFYFLGLHIHCGW